VQPPSTADLADAYGDALRYCGLPFRDVGGCKAFFGPVRTLSCRDDNAQLQRLTGETAEGTVLVVDGQRSLATALLGDVGAARALGNGWGGFVIVGAVRDVKALGGLPIGIKCLATTPRRSGQTGAGVIDAPVALADIIVAPGDWLYADEDGVVVSDCAVHLVGAGA
jgi:regulator of ribonuclease activity A